MDDTGIPSHLKLAVGESRTFPLASLAMAGYRWSGSVGGDDPGAVAFEVRRAALPPSIKPGLAVPEEAVVSAIRPGRAVACLEQRRSWEDQGAPALRVEVQVEVGGRRDRLARILR